VAAFKKLSLSIQQGEFVSIVGPSGCGKTTLLFSIAGFIQPTSGRILVDGELISGPGPNRGVVFQSFALFNWLTVRQNVEFGLQWLECRQKDDAHDPTSCWGWSV